jgi:hypothetical protein
LEAADVGSRQGDAPQVAVEHTRDAPAQVVPGGSVVTRPVPRIAPSAREGGPVSRACQESSRHAVAMSLKLDTPEPQKLKTCPALSCCTASHCMAWIGQLPPTCLAVYCNTTADTQPLRGLQYSPA